MSKESSWAMDSPERHPHEEVKPLYFGLQRNYKKVRLSTTPFIAFDVENDTSVGGAESLTHAHLYGKYLKRATKKVKNPFTGKEKKIELPSIEVTVDEHFTCKDDLVSYLNGLIKRKHRGKLPFILVGFNTSYDYPFIQETCDDSKKLINSGSFISGRMKNGIKIIDIRNHYKYGSLEDAMKSFNMEQKYGIRKLPLTEEFIAERNRFDAMATYYLAVEFRQMYNALGVDLRLTAPSNALDMFQNHFMPENFSVHREDPVLNNFERRSYFGGRCEMFVRGKQNILSYDVHSMYPSVMKDELYPDPMSARHFISPSEDFWKKWYYDPERYLGIYSVTVEAPDMNIPVLAIKFSSDQYEKLIFPVGKFSGVWTSEELRYAEECGYRIISCDEFIVYRKKLPLFRSYIDHWWGERVKYKADNNTPMADLCKLMMNSLYGKLGQYQRKGGFCGKEEDFPWDEIDMSTFNKRITRAVMGGVPMIVIPPDRTYEDSRHTIPCIASFVTSYARIKLCKGLHDAECGGLVPVYSDTDSIKITSPDGSMPDREICDRIIGAHDSKLGRFGYEYSGRRYFQTQKVNAGITMASDITTRHEIEVIDKSDVTIKGMNRKNCLINITGALDDPDTVVWHGDFDSPVRENESIRRQIPVDLWIERHKDISGHGSKRVWTGQYSRPIRL